MTNPRDKIEAALGLSGPPVKSFRSTPPSVPDHELLRKIGQGAYGEVWLAKNTLGTLRAIKVVYRDNFKDSRPYEREFSGIRRFEPLSRANEGFVDILHVGCGAEDTWFYYVMELADPFTIGDLALNQLDLEGVSRDSQLLVSPEYYLPHTLARDLQQRSRLPLDECLELGLTLSLALAHLHRHGLIHRDVKPSNIIFVGGIPKLADIGLVTEASEANTFVGTEGFVPPEGPTSPQADLYALGKVLYEGAMGKDRHEFPEPFSQLRADAESIALMELNAILLRACATDPKERYATAEEMNADLALLRSGGSVKRRHQIERRIRFVQRLGALAAAAALLAGGAWFWQQRQTNEMAKLATSNARLAQERTALAQHLTKADSANRESLARLRTANGFRLLEDGDPAGALLWFVNALLLETNKPSAERIHRIRIQQTLNQTPRLLRAFPHDFGVSSAVLSPDGETIATATKDGSLRLWSAKDGNIIRGPYSNAIPIRLIRFTKDGRYLLGSSSAEQGRFNETGSEHASINIFDLEAESESAKPFTGFDHPLCIHFSPDDRWIAGAEMADHSIRVFALTNAQPVAELLGHTAPVRYLSFSRDGSILASASLDRTVRLWKLPSGEPLGAPMEHRWPVVRVLLTDDGRRAVTAIAERQDGNAGFEVNVWDTASGTRLAKSVRGRDSAAMFLSTGSKGPLFVQGRPPNPLKAYDLNALDESSQDLRDKVVLSWDFKAEGEHIVLGFGDNRAQIFNVYTQTPLLAFRHSRWGVNSVHFSPDHTTLLTGSEDGIARLWSALPLSDGSIHRPVLGGLSPGWTYRARLELGRTSKLFPIKSSGGSVGIFNNDLQEKYRFTPDQPGTEIIGPSQSANGKFWAIRNYDLVSGFQTGLTLGIEENGKVQKVKLFTSGGSPGYFDSTFTPDSRFLISVSTAERIHIWETADGRLHRTIEIPNSFKGELREISPDGRSILSWDEPLFNSSRFTRRIRFFDLDSESFIGAGFEAPISVFSAVFSPDGKYVALLDEIGPATVLESRSGKIVNSSIRHPATLTRVHWDFTGQRLLTVGRNDEVLLWDALKGASPLHSLRSPGQIIRDGRWSPDDRFVATTSSDYKVRVWDVETGELVTPPLNHGDILAAAFFTRGDRLITVSYAGESELRVWDLKPTSLPANILIDHSTFLATRSLDSAGIMRALTPSEVVTIGRVIRERGETTEALIAETSVSLVEKSQSRQGVFEIPSHTLASPQRLSETGRSNCLALEIPLRILDTPASLIDLSAFYNLSLSPIKKAESPEATYNNFLHSLPVGIQKLPHSHVLHDLRGVIQLARVNNPLSHPQRVNGIPIGAKVRRLNFLQATAWSGRDGVEIGKYVIHYTNGTFEQSPIVYGKHIRDWVERIDDGEVTDAVVAWRGSNDYWGAIRLFLQTWENPRPDLEVKAVDFVSRMTECAPFLVAITQE